MDEITNGDWAIIDGPLPDCYNIWAGDTYVAEVYSTKADATAIAAVPKMLQALRSAAASMQSLLHVLPEVFPANMEKSLVLVLQAIVEAEGR